MKYVKILLAAAIVWLLLVCASSAQSLRPPPPPPDLVPFQGAPRPCSDNETGERGTCMMASSKTTGIWLMFYQDGLLVMLRNVPKPGDKYIIVWRHPAYASY